MKTKELLEVYKAIFETWRFQVNSHWQRSSFFAAFETAALAACWKLLTEKSDTQTAAPALGFLLTVLGTALTIVWLLINERTHSYALYWLDAVGEIETRLMKGGCEWGIDFARKIPTTIKRGPIEHHNLERAVPALFLVAWIALFLSGICHLTPVIGCGAMHGAISYESVSLAIAIASLLASAAATLIAKSSLSQAKQVADRDHKDWKQRKWFDLYFKADEAYDALDRFQALYPSPSSPGWDMPEWQRESHNLMRIMRTVHRIAVVFPRNPEVQALFEATAVFSNADEYASKDRLSKIFDAVEGIRQKALIDTSVLE
jgi:hypothetical protein